MNTNFCTNKITRIDNKKFSVSYYTDPLLVFFAADTDAHRQISEHGIRRISGKYAVKNRN
ncbi:MAG: hypothetical protein BWK80_03065 [Desulfobacteraceae bacterium IS3]|nr:MAG: hypothetical protein BWK80_03065 [Desulfobacteraceae bacterium IS3]